MAAGIGLRLLQVHGIEKGRESNALIDLYEQWLTDIEGWSDSQRTAQLTRARKSLRFVTVTIEDKGN